MKINRKVKSVSVICRYASVLLVGLSVSLFTGCGDSGGSSSSTNAIGTTGRGGSTARMTIPQNSDYLYAIAGSDVQLFDITQPQSPNPWTRVRVDWDIETLFPYGDYLLIGAATGMHIMDNRNPAEPQYLSRFTHAQARDPIIAHRGYAYVTLRTEGFGVTNQMDVVDIRDIYNPRLVKSIPMQGPSGLTEGQENLYVCDDIAGIKIFDLSDPEQPSVVDTIRNVKCNDVLTDGRILYVITDDSLIQYDYTTMPPTFLSEVKAVSLD